MGSRLARGYVASEDSELMARFRRAGFVLTGTTQTPELGYNPTTETVLFGPVHNPWKAGHSAGGSSGGSGASVARPALCRLPMPMTAVAPFVFRPRVTVWLASSPRATWCLPGPTIPTRCVAWRVSLLSRAASATPRPLLDIVAGADAGAPGIPVPPARPYREEVNAAPGQLRIAWTTTPASGEKVDPECEQAVHDTVRVLEELGHTVYEGRPEYDWEEFLENVHVIWVAYNAMAVEDLAAEMGRSPSPDTLEAVTLACWEDGKKYSAVDLLKSLDHGGRLSRIVGRFFEDLDVFVTPTIAKPPAPHGEVNQNRAGMTAVEWTRQVFSYVPFTPLFNTTGQPAISLPLHWSADGLPVGVQFVGHFGDEAGLLRLAAQLEAAKPWADKRPPVHVAA